MDVQTHQYQLICLGDVGNMDIQTVRQMDTVIFIYTPQNFVHGEYN